MSNSQAQTKSEVLLNRVYEIGHSGRTNELALQRIVREAEPIALIEPLNYEYIMGAVACIREDEVAMRKHYSNAITHHPSAPESHFNFANSLVRLGYDYEALFQLDKALELNTKHEAANDLKNTILDHIEEQMWADMESDTEDDLLGFCMNATGSIEGDTSCEVT